MSFRMCFYSQEWQYPGWSVLEENDGPICPWWSPSCPSFSKKHIVARVGPEEHIDVLTWKGKGMIVKIIKLRKRSLLSPTPCYFTAFQAYPTESINYILIANLLCFWKLTIPSRGCRKFGSCDVQQSKLIPQKITENLELQRQCQGLEKTPMHLPKGKIRQHSLI